jgi:hypothetical protein
LPFPEQLGASELKLGSKIMLNVGLKPSLAGVISRAVAVNGLALVQTAEAVRERLRQERDQAHRRWSRDAKAEHAAPYLVAQARLEGAEILYEAMLEAYERG